MTTIVRLMEYGVDTVVALERCFGDEEFYLELVRMVPGEANFTRLEEAVAKKDLAAGFDAAHALKGVLANLSLTPLTETAGQITELLRSRTDTDYSVLLERLNTQKDELKKICEE